MSEDHATRLLGFLWGVPDPQEAFELLDLLRDMQAITGDEAAFLMREYWGQN